MNSKCVVTLGYKEYVVDEDEVLTLLGILSRLEMFRETYENKHTAYYVFPQDAEDNIRATVKLLPEDVYRIAKLAGKPLTKNM